MQLARFRLRQEMFVGTCGLLGNIVAVDVDSELLEDVVFIECETYLYKGSSCYLLPKQQNNRLGCMAILQYTSILGTYTSSLEYTCTYTYTYTCILYLSSLEMGQPFAIIFNSS